MEIFLAKECPQNFRVIVRVNLNFQVICRFRHLNSNILVFDSDIFHSNAM